MTRKQREESGGGSKIGPAAGRRVGPPPRRSVFPLRTLFGDIPRVRVVDVGASDLDGAPPFLPLLEAGNAEIVGFEPDADQHRRLLDLKRENATYLPHAVGDGDEGTLHICKSPGMTSLLEPDHEVLRHFHMFTGWGTVVRTERCPTKRLDDLPEVEGADYLKVDVQGGELDVLRGGRKLLEQILVVHIEVQFVPFYKDQPLFAELDQELRGAGFFLHQLLPIKSRVFKPMKVNDDVYAGLSQQLWTDAVYIRRFTDFERLDVEQLLLIALITHDCYGSFDLATLALGHVDRKQGSSRQREYMQKLAEHLAAPHPGPPGRA